MSMTIEWVEPTPLPNTDKQISQEYDLELLPETIRNAAKEISRFSKVPVESPSIVGLSCVAVAIGKKSVIVEKEGLEHYPSLFFVLIAASGERKSPIFKYMKQPLDDWCKEQMEKYEEDKKYANSVNITADIELTAIKSLIKKAVNKNTDTNTHQQDLIDNEDKRIDIPAKPSLYVTDATEERLFQKMQERGEAYAVMSGEGRSALDQILGKYTGGNGTGDTLYLAAITGDTVTRDRVGKSSKNDKPEDLIMYQPCLNVCIMVQPDKYQEVASHSTLRESGTLARIMSIRLASLVGTRFEEENEAGLSAEILNKYSSMIKNILNAKPPEIDGKPLHKVLLSTEVQKARRVFHNNIELMMATDKEFEDVRDIASKAVSQTVKIAHILHIADNPNLLSQPESVIDINTWDKAQHIGKFHLDESVQMQRSAFENKDVAYAKKILAYLTKKKYAEITPRVIQQNVRPKPNSKKVEFALNLLCDYGYLHKLGDVYLVNPSIV